MVTNVQPPLLLNPLPKTGIAAFREKPTFLGRVVKVLTSPKTTVVLGGTLATLVTAGAVAPALTSAALRGGTAATVRGTFSQAKTLIPKTLGGKVLLVTGISALTSSPILRSLVVRKLNPVSTGRELGLLVEDPSKLFPKDTTAKGVREKIKDIAKTAGLIGGVAAATVGGVILAKKGIEKVKSIIPSRSPAPPSQITPFAILPAATPISSLTQPLGAVQKPVEEDKVTKAIPSIPSIKITNKPEINIKFSKSRKFINQQILVKQ